MRHLGAAQRGRTTLAAGAMSMLGIIALAGCGDDPDRGQAAYCDLIAANADALRAPAIATPDDITATVELYRTVQASAPLSVAEEWTTLLDSVETASTVDPEKPESVQAAADTARRSTPAAQRAAQITQELCGVDLASSPPGESSTSNSSP